mgnify:CR=1 FL=1
MIPKTKEELIAAIRNILTALGETDFCWSELNLGWSPILQEGNNVENTFGLDWVEMDGVSGSSCWDEGHWSWDELPLDTIQTIYDEMSDYWRGR